MHPHRALLVVLVLIGILGLPVSLARAATDVSAIPSDASWTLAGSPYLLHGDVTVPVGVTLSIDAGAAIHADADASLRVEGRIVAVGTGGAPVRFRSGVASPASGDWDGVTIASSETGSVLSHVTISEADTGLHVVGGRDETVALSELTLSDGGIGLHLDASQVSAADLEATGNTVAGVRVENGDIETSNAFSRVLVRDNAVGFLIRKTSLLALELSVDHATIAYNGGHAFDMYDEPWPERIRVTLTASVVAANAGYVFYGGNAYGTGVRPVVTWSYCDLWGNTAGVYNLYNDATEGEGNFNYLPLFRDAEARDLVPTQRSPLRYNDGADGTVGVHEYAGDPSDGVAGFYWEDHVFAAGEHVVDGDIVVTPRATVTFAPGAALRLVPGDVMSGGLDAARVEIRNLGALAMRGEPGAPVTLSSAAAEPAPGDWHGVSIAGGALATDIAEVDLAHAQAGFRFEDSFHGLRAVEVHDCEVGLLASGGGPLFEDSVARDCETGVRVLDADAEVAGLRVTGNATAGISVELSGALPREVLIDRCILHDNEDLGLRVYKDGVADLAVVLDRSTLWANGGDATYCDDFAAPGRLRLDARYCVIGRNGGAAFGAVDRGGEDYAPQVAYAYTDAWENDGGLYDWHVLLEDGEANLAYDPLFRDADAGDFVPTSRSPLRCTDRYRDDNGDGLPDPSGALDYQGDETDGLVGFTHGDLWLDAAGSPYVVEGDLVVTSPCLPDPAELRVEAGVEIRFAAGTDRLRGGLDPERTELVVRDDLVIAGGRDPAVFTSAAAAPVPGDWQGILLEKGATVLAEGFEIMWAEDGFRGAGSAEQYYEDGVLHDLAGWGFRFDTGAGPSLVDLRIERAGVGGVYLADLVGRALVARSTIVDCGLIGVRVKNSHARVENNVIVGSDWGLFSRRTVDDDMRVEIVNNTFYDLARDCVRNHNSARWGKVDFVVLNNQLTWCGGFAILDSGGFDVRDFCDYNNFWETLNFEIGQSHYGVAVGAHSLSVPPHYEDIDPTGARRWFDLRLAGDAAVIDAGLSAGEGYDDLLTLDDHDGRERPLGGGLDIGAYEHDPDASNHDPVAVATGDALVPAWEERFGDRACFDASASSDPDGDALTFAWDFGDGETGYGVAPCHAYAGSTSYSVVLTVTDARRGVDHDVLDVEVNQRPVADAGPAVDAVAGGEPVNFDGSGSSDADGSVVAYAWDFGDGSLGEGVRPSHAYAPGPSREFTVTLVVTDDDGHDSAPATTLAQVSGDGDGIPPVITHEPRVDPRYEGSGDLVLAATLSDDSGIGSAAIHYRGDGAATWSTVDMLLVAGDAWSGSIPEAALLPPGLSYYLEASDGYATPNTATHPSGAPGSGVHHVEVLPFDGEGPQFEHDPVANGQARDHDVEVVARVSDPGGVGAVSLFYRHTTDPVYEELAMTVDPDGETWRATIPAVRVQSPGLQYYLWARDLSPQANTATLPATGAAGPYSFTVVEPDDTAPLLLVTPVLDGRQEGDPVTVAAVVSDESGVGAVTLYVRPGDGAEFRAIDMAPTGVGNGYEALIPGGEVLPPSVAYYVVATDASVFANETRWPEDGPEAPASFTVVTEVEEDRTAPVIEHEPPAGPLAPGVPVELAVQISDASGVAEAALHYRDGNTLWQELALVDGGGGSFTATVPGADVIAGELRYYATAVDGSLAANTATRPAAGAAAPWVVPVGLADPEPPPDAGSGDIGGDTGGDSGGAVTETVDGPETVSAPDTVSEPETASEPETVSGSETVSETTSGDDTVAASDGGEGGTDPSSTSSSSGGGCAAAPGGSSPWLLLLPLLFVVRRRFGFSSSPSASFGAE